METKALIEMMKSRQLAKAGFELIRNALKKDDTTLAFDIAEALHNFPESSDNAVQITMTRESIQLLCEKYPENQALEELLQINDPDNTVGYEMLLDLKDMAKRNFHKKSESTPNINPNYTLIKKV